MKNGREHRVPLSAPALDILEEVLPLRRSASGLVFPGQSRTRPLSDVALAKALRAALRGVPEASAGATVHGMRSTFRDWCAEATNWPREVAEAALAHTNPNRVESAYARTDHFEKRRALMEAWAEHCLRDPKPIARVVPIRA